MALSDAKIRAIKPKAKTFKVSDFGGLYLSITPKGSKLWRQKYRFNGKEGTLSHGPYPEISLKDARDLRDEAKALLKKGQNPAQIKQKTKDEELSKSEHIFNKVADQFVDKLTKEGRSPATLNKLHWLLEDARKDFGHMLITEITAPIILKSLRKREKLGHYETANRMKSRIGGVFRYAVACGITDNDPTYALKDALIKPTVTHRAAITDKKSLGELLHHLDDYSGHIETAIAMRLLIQFACRPCEIREAKWEEFDIENCVWHPPKERMKMRRPHRVPLPDSTLSRLAELRKLTGWGALLFPSQVNSKKPISDNTLNQALKRMGFGSDEVTPHGFRSTFSTFANESGLWSPDVIEAYCARQDRNAVRRAYNRSLYWDERVKLADWWALQLEGLLNKS
jgi:integrase